VFDALRLRFPDWLLQFLLAVMTLAVLGLPLLLARVLWREWKRGEWYGKAIISEFLSEAMEPIRMSPPADDLCLEWKLHDVRRLNSELRLMRREVGSWTSQRGTVLDSWVLSFAAFGESSLRTAVQNFVAHYQSERNHQGLGNR
jgi:hypothetical protein